MGEFIKDRLPDVDRYFEVEGVCLVGRGLWKTGPCHLHGGSDSLRVNTQSGGWICMSCGAKGGDVLAYHMQRYGLQFFQAARALGAYADDGKCYSRKATPTPLSARDAIQLAAHEMRIVFVVVADVRAGVIPNEADWQRFIEGARRVEALAQEYAA